MKTLQKETEALRKRLVNRMIRDVTCYSSLSGDSYIKIGTDKGSLITGVNELGVWLAKEKDLE